MQQAYDLSDERRWQEICRAEFGLSPLEVATLAAIVAYCQTQNVSAISLGTLRGIAETLDRSDVPSDPIDPVSAPGRLHVKGLLTRYGTPANRAFAPTPRGIRRLRS